MPFCRACGRWNNSANSFCVSCGRPMSATVPPAPPSQKTEKGSSRSRKARILKWTGIVAGGLVGLFILLIILVNVFGDSSEGQANTSVPRATPAGQSAGKPVASNPTPTQRLTATATASPTATSEPIPSATPMPMAAPTLARRALSTATPDGELPASVIRWREWFQGHNPNLIAMEEAIESAGEDRVIDEGEHEWLCFVYPQWEQQLEDMVDYSAEYYRVDPETVRANQAHFEAREKAVQRVQAVVAEIGPTCPED